MELTVGNYNSAARSIRSNTKSESGFNTESREVMEQGGSFELVLPLIGL